MRLALFTDTFVPQMNGVALTLGRFTDYLNRRGIEHLVFSPKARLIWSIQIPFVL
jgi:phosphatidylinositol alpha 1,6-mannosyltransferase